MSLLMEALRKAEEAKRKSQQQESPPPPPPEAEAIERVRAVPLRSPFSLEPREPHPVVAPEPEPAAAPPAPAPPPAPPQSAGAVVIETPRDEVQDYLAADPVPEDNSPLQSTGRRQRATRQSRDQLAAASVFAAKQGAPRDPRRQKRLLALLGAGLMITVSGGATLWYLQSMPGSGMAINPGIANYDLASRGFLDEQVPAAATEAASGTPATAVAEQAVATEAPPVVAEATPAEPVAAPPEAVTAPADQPATPASTAPATADPAAVTVLAGATAQPAAVPAAQDDQPQVLPGSETRTLEITRSTSRSAVNSTLQSAWNALQAGELQTATLLYTEVLTEQPNDRDALIGLAAIQLRNGQPEQARQTYVQLLTLNPQDPYARAGLLQASQVTSDPAHETELKNLLQRYPELPPLHFALGNFYAGQQRWSEAQASYFDALLHANRDTGTPVSPDYAFNLAVSLEQLQQPEAALNYYRQALDLSRSSPAGFDMSLLQSRLGLLQERTQE